MAPEKILNFFDDPGKGDPSPFPGQKGTDKSSPSFSVNDILRDHLAWINTCGEFNDGQRSAAHLMAVCKTAELGTFVEYCPNCDEIVDVHYRSCGNRNCPKCQYPFQQRWKGLRESERVPDAPYFHLVMTLPHDLNPLVAQNSKELLSLLFRAAAKAVIEMCMDPKRLGVKPGIISVLHTWTQDLRTHYHVHMICMAGGLDENGLYKALDKLYVDESTVNPQNDCADSGIGTESMQESSYVEDLDVMEDMPDGSSSDKSGDASTVNQKDENLFFLPQSALMALFRGKFMAELCKMYNSHELSLKGSLDYLNDPYEWATFCQKLRNKVWVGHIVRTFNGKGNAIEYLARYTFRTAISNSRIVDYDGKQVSFTVRVNGKPGEKDIVTLDAHEFIRRLLSHILPKGFTRVRSYGILANGQKKKCLDIIFQQLTGEDFQPSELKDAKGIELLKLLFPDRRIGLCPCCGQPVQIYSREFAWEARARVIHAARAAPGSMAKE